MMVLPWSLQLDLPITDLCITLVVYIREKIVGNSSNNLVGIQRSEIKRTAHGFHFKRTYVLSHILHPLSYYIC